MYNESDLVAILKNVPDKKLFRGDVGTIAFVYEGGGLYEVEFINAAGDTLAVVTLADTEICVVQLQSAILHVADLPAQNAA